MRDGQRKTGGAALAIVPTPVPQPTGPLVQFCGHCGARPKAETVSRVCRDCGLGLLLEADAEAAPREGAAFIVLDSSLSVCAVSGPAETLLATCETEAVNQHLTELLVPADAEAQGASNLAVAVTWAARGEGEPSRVFVRPTQTFGVRLSARIASCTSPTAALVVFE
jgi:hypothetical protein